MFILKDEHIDFILQDIKNNGLENQDLILNLLDHICCIIEENLEEEGNLEEYYNSIKSTFYHKSYLEIEEETNLLLTFKNYYAMKKVMLFSGIFSASILSLGIIFKFMHWPGASIGIVLSLGVLSFVFLPLLFTLRVKEKSNTRDKILLVAGAIPAILMSLSVLFKIQHWPFANTMGYLTILILLFIYLPLFYTSGVKHPETKINTVITSIIIIVGCGLFLTLVVTPKTQKAQLVKATANIYRSEQILEKEKILLVKMNSLSEESLANSSKSKILFEELDLFKTKLVKFSGGIDKLNSEFIANNNFLEDVMLDDYLDGQKEEEQLVKLRQAILDYNKAKLGNEKINIETTFLDNKSIHFIQRVPTAITEIIQIQMQLIQSQREFVAQK
jgi:hypothetical protein